MRHRRGRHEERARDLVGLEAAQHAEGQGDPCLERKRRVAAGEDQPKAIVPDFTPVVIRHFGSRHQPGRGVQFQLFREPRPAPDAVKGLMPSRLDQPCAWELRDAGAPPLVHGGGKGFLRRLFGEVEVAEEPNQRSDDPAPIGAINRVDGEACVLEHTQL